VCLSCVFSWKMLNTLIYITVKKQAGGLVTGQLSVTYDSSSQTHSTTGLKGDENGQNMHIPCMMQIHHLKTAIKKTEQSIKPNVLDCTHQYTSTIILLKVQTLQTRSL